MQVFARVSKALKILIYLEKKIPHGENCYGCPWFQGHNCYLFGGKVVYSPDYKSVKKCEINEMIE